MVSWDNQSQQMSQTDFTEWMFVRRSVTSLVLMGCAPGGRHTKWGGAELPEGVAGPVRGCYGRAEHRQGTKEAAKKTWGLREDFSE